MTKPKVCQRADCKDHRREIRRLRELIKLTSDESAFWKNIAIERGADSNAYWWEIMVRNNHGNWEERP